MLQALSTNNYGPAKFIVDATLANGTHSTIATALISASIGGAMTAYGRISGTRVG